jgi:hypothetical protein
MRPLQWTLWGIGLVLQCSVLTVLLRGALRDFRVIFVYVFLLLATTVGDITALYTVGRDSPVYHNYYWGAELTRQSTMFLVVVSLALDVIPDNRRRRVTLNLVMAAAALFWLGSLVLTHQPELNAWMTKVVRNLSFGSAVLDLGLWFTLISSRTRDSTRLLIVGGLGLQMTGEALGTSIRQLFPSFATALAGSLFVVFAHFLCLMIWLYAFSRLTSKDPVG